MTRRRAIWVFALVSAIALATLPVRVFAQEGDDPLVELQFDIVGLRLEVDPPALTVPKGIATIVNAGLVVPAGSVAEVEDAIGAFSAGAEVVAELRGPSIPPRTIRVKAGEPIPIPPLALPGDYFLDQIRLVKGGQTILDGTPNVVPIKVISEIFITSVTSRPLSLEEIRSKGVIIDDENFDAFNFQLALNIDNVPFTINLPVAHPSRQLLAAENKPQEIVRQLANINKELAETTVVELPPEFDRPGLNFAIAALPFIPAKLEDDNSLPFGAPPITGLIVIPGNIAFLNQFFSVLLTVVNVAPDGTTLVLNDVEAEIILPTGADRQAGAFDDPGDDPLRLARIEGIGVQPIIPIAQVGTDGQLGTADDIPRIAPGDMGEGEFLVEGLREGAHTFDIDISAVLEGLPSGPVELVGAAAGVVLVKNPSFSITLSHPRTVRAGELYDLYATITNTSEVDANLVSVNLPENSISGARLCDDDALCPGNSESALFETLSSGESGTAKFTLISQQTGEVTFASFTTEPGVTGRFSLRTGVGERGVPLAPNAIVLPATADLLPPDLVFAAVRVLGQGLSVSTAPTLPPDVLFVSRSTIVERGRDLAEAGQRVQFGEPLERAISDLLLDWLGNDTASPGFDQLLRETNAGASFISEVAKVLNGDVLSSSVLDMQAAMAQATVPRSPHLSVVTGQDAGAAPVLLSILDASGNILGQAGGETEFDIPVANLLPLQTNGGRAELGVIGRPESDSYTVEVVGTGTGTFDLGMIVPAGVGAFTQLIYEDVPIQNGGTARVTINLTNGNTFFLSVDEDGDGGNDQTLSPAQVSIVEGAPQILTVRQLESSFYDRAGNLLDPASHGLLVGVLFDKPVTQESAEDALNYEVEVNNVESARLQPSGRLVYLYLQKPIGSLVERSITISDIADARGNLLAEVTQPIETVLTDGAHVFGQVRQADGTPVPGALFALTVIFGDSGFTVATIRTDTEGSFDLDYVTALGDGIILFAQDPESLDTTTLRAKIRAPGQMLLLNPILLGKGVVRGTIFNSDGSTVPGIEVRLHPSGFNRGTGTNANALGEYTLTGIPVGTYRVNARGPDGAFGESAGVLESAGAESITDVELILQPDQVGRLVGRVFLSGGQIPAEGFDVYVGNYDRRQNIISSVGQTVTDESGSFAFENILAGTYDAVAVDPATQQLGVSRRFQVLPQITNSTNIVLEALGNVQGCVFNAQNQPVPGALVTGGLELVEANAQGCFLVEGVPAGKRIIEAGNPDTLRRGKAEIAVLPGQTVNVVIQLEARASIEGRVLDANGNPVPEAVVRLPSIDGYEFVFANDGGIFRFPDLHLGSYLIQAPGPSKQSLINYMLDKGMDPAAAFTACDIAPGCNDFPPEGSPPTNVGNLNSALNAYQNAIQTLFSVQDPQLTGVGEQQTGFYGWNKVKLLQDSTTVIADVQFLPVGTVSGTTLDANGLPTGAAIRLLALGMSGTGLPKFSELARTTTDPETGEFSFFGIPRFDLTTFQATGIRSGNFTLEAAHPFTPARAKFNGQLNVNNPNLNDIELQFPPETETNGDITGVVYLPDGVTSAPEDTEVAISFGDLVVQTDADGTFQTQNNLLPGDTTYLVTATAPDGLTGQVSVRVPPGGIAEVEVTLLGLGDVEVTVIRPNGQVVPNADVTLKRGTYPQDEASNVTDANGLVQFFNITEGRFSVTAVEQGTGLKGVANDFVLKDGLVEVTVTIKASGTVRGKFVASNGQTPIENAQIELTSKDGTKAFASTDAQGRFELFAVPIGQFTVEGSDPLTRVAGRFTGQIRFEGEMVDITVVQHPRGTVEGAVLQADESTPVAGAPIVLSVSGFGGLRIQATTGSDGGFSFDGVPAGEFTLQAHDPLSDFDGTARGTLRLEGEVVLQNVIIEPFGAVQVQVLDSDGSSVGNAEVELSGDATFRTASVDANGEFTFEFLPLGSYKVIARSIANQRNAGQAAAELAIAGETRTVDVTLNGLADVTVTVEDATGQLVPSARVTLTAQASFGSERPGVGGGTLPAFFTDANGEVNIPGAPVGDFFVKAESGAVSGLVTDTIAAPGDSVAVTIQLGGSGAIFGSVLLPNGVTPAANAIVTLAFESQSGLQSGFLQVNTDLSGAFGTAAEPEFTGIPIGPFTLDVFEIVSQGVQIVTGTIDTDGQLVDLGALTLDNTAPSIVQTMPEDGASGVSVNIDIVVEFDEPIQTSSLTVGLPNPNLVVMNAEAILGQLTLSNNNQTATFTPNDPLESDTLYTITILGAPEGPKNTAGLELLDSFVASFRTQDVIPPTVVSVSPSDGRRQVLPEAVVRLTFSEAIGDAFDLTVADSAGQAISGNIQTALGGTVAIFTPINFLKPNDIYDVTLASVEDIASNPLVGGTFTSQFFTVDTIPPQIVSLDIEGAPSLVEGTDVTITPNIPSSDVTRVEYLIEGQAPQVRRTAPFSLSLTLPTGKDSILISATAVDVVGNRSQPATELVIPIGDNTPPSITLTNLTGVTNVTRGQSLSFEATATDDLGLDSIVFSTLGETSVSATEDAPEGSTDFTATFGFTVPNTARSGRTITVQAVGVDESNAESAPATIDLVIEDTQAPTATISSPVNNAQVVPGVVNVVVTAVDDVALQAVTLTCNPNVTGCETRTITPTAGNTIQIFALNVPALGTSATIQLAASATDTNGNTSVEFTRTIRLADEEPPQVTSLELVGGGTQVLAGDAVTVRAQATDNIAVRSVEFSLEGPLTQTTNVNVAPNTSPTADFTFTVPPDANENLIVTARAFDAALPSAPVELTLDVIPDTQTPTVAVVEPTAGARVIEGDTFTVRVSASDDVAVSRVTLDVSGVLTDSLEQLFNPANSPVEAVFEVDVPQGTSLGNLTLDVTAEDPAGNIASDSLIVEVIDGEAPVVQIVSPTEGDDIDPRSPLSVTVNATDNLGVTSITLAAEGVQDFSELRTIASSTDATEIFDIVFDPLPITGGTLTLRATASDSSGSVSDEAVVIINVLDFVPPQVVAVTPPDGTTNVVDGVSVIVDVSEPLDPATVSSSTVTLTPDGGLPVDAQVSLSADGLTITLDPDADLDVSTLHTLALSSEITDVAGNSLDAFTSEFTVGGGAPPTIISTPVTTATVGQPYAYQVGADDPDFGDTLTFSLDTAPIEMIINSISGLIQWVPFSGQEGDNDVVVRVTDSTGLFDTQSFTVQVAAQNTPPIADAGEDQGVFVGDVVTLDGSGSSDPDGDGLTFAWTFISTPAGSGATLANADTDSPTFTADVEGSYTVQLVVNDGLADSEPDAVVVTAVFRNAIALTPATLNLLTRDTGAMTVTLAEPAGVGGQVIDLESDDTAVAQVPNSVLVTEGQTSADFDVQTGIVSGSAAITASATGFLGDSAQVNVSLRNMALDVETLLIGVGGDAIASVTLAQPAPDGGVTVNLDIDANFATATPQTLDIAGGGTLAGTLIVGIAEGQTDLTASADGYMDATVGLTITNNIIGLGNPITLAPGQTVSSPLTLNQPAPAGGVTINLESDDTNIATVTPSVFVPEGQISPTTNPQITGVGIGSTTITALADGFVSDTQGVTVTLTLNFSPTTLSVVENNTRNITLNLSAPAPVGGLTVDLSTDDPAVATVADNVLIGQGQTSAAIQVTGITPNASTTLRANVQGVQEATATINVTPAPPINVGDATVGKDLQGALNGSLGAAAPAGNVQVTITSLDPSRLLLSNAATSPGTASINIQVGAGATFITTFYLQALDDTGTAEITISAPGYATDTSTITFVPSGFAFIATSLDTTTFSANTNLTVRSVRLNPSNSNVAAEQDVRGGLSVSVDVDSSDPNVGTVTSPATIVGGTSRATVSFDPVNAGETILSMTQPAGYTVPANGSQEIAVTVTAPGITVTDTTVGRNLQAANSIFLETAPPSPVDVTLTVEDDSVATISTDRTQAGSNQIVIEDVSGTFVGTVYVQGLVEGSTTLTASAADYEASVGDVDVVPSGFAFIATSLDTTTFSANTNVTVRSVRLNPINSNVATEQDVRGGLSVSVDVDSSDPNVGTVTNPAVINGGASRTTVSFDPINAGETTLGMTQPAGYTVPANGPQQIAVTVTAPGISISDTIVGVNLQQSRFVSLETAPPAPVDVTITVEDDSVATISTDPTVAGGNQIVIENVTGTTVGTIYVQGLVEGSTTITASAADYETSVSDVDVAPSGFAFIASTLNTTTFSTNTNLTVRAVRLNPSNSNVAAEQDVRGGLSVSVDVDSSDPNVGTVTSPAVINGGASRTTVSFDPINAGEATLSMTQPAGYAVPANGPQQIAVTVTAPDITFGLASANVGLNLQQTLSVGLQSAPPNPVDIVVTVSSTSIATISADATAEGSDTITFQNVSNTTARNVYVQGRALGSTTITVQATGYNDGFRNVVVNPSGFAFVTGSFSIAENAANSNVTLRSLRLDPVTLNISTEQNVRGGLTADIEALSSDTDVGTITNPIQIAANNSRGTGSFDPISGGQTTLSITQPDGFSVPSNGLQEITITVFGITVPAGQENLSLLTGVVPQASSVFSATYEPPNAIDNNFNTGWFTANNDPAPMFTVIFPQEVTVHSLQIVPHLSFLTGFNFITGQFQLLDAADAVLFDSGSVSFSNGFVDVSVNPDVSGVRKAVFSGITWGSIEPGFGEFGVVGTVP